MISRLIDIGVKPIVSHRTVKQIKTNYSIKDYATAFISGMGETQLNRFKKMLENNIHSGMSIAENYGVNYDDFIEEVKKELNVKEVN